MKFGVAVTTSSNPALTARAQADYVGRLTPAIEGLGYDSAWVSDRTVFPPDIADRYPEAFGPGRSDPEAQRVLEAMTTLTFIAGSTRSVRLGFSVLVLPFRHAVLNAKMITTLDVLPGGRVIFGVGTGWMREEFEGMGATYGTRGAVTDEHIEMFKELCARDVPSYQGKHVGIDGAVFYPRPLQAPHPPVWVGGNSTAALRRAARLGDGWHGIGLGPGELSAKRKALRRLCEQVGRDPAEVEVSLRATLRLGAARVTSAGDRTPLTGTVLEVVDDLRRYEDAGLEYLVLSVADKDTNATIESIERFAAEVRPALT